MIEKNKKPSDNFFFVSSSTSVNVFFKENGQQKSERFRLSLTLKSRELDKDGFVIDFITLKNFLQTVKEKINHKHVEDFINEEFSYKPFLDFLYSEFNSQLLNDDIIISRIVLESENENFGAEY